MLSNVPKNQFWSGVNYTLVYIEPCPRSALPGYISNKSNGKCRIKIRKLDNSMDQICSSIFSVHKIMKKIGFGQKYAR